MTFDPLTHTLPHSYCRDLQRLVKGLEIFVVPGSNTGPACVFFFLFLSCACTEYGPGNRACPCKADQTGQMRELRLQLQLPLPRGVVINTRPNRCRLTGLAWPGRGTKTRHRLIAGSRCCVPCAVTFLFSFWMGDGVELNSQRKSKPRFLGIPTQKQRVKK